MARARHRDERAAAGALGRPDQALRGQESERLADGRPADAEVVGENRLLREAAALLEHALEDLLAQPSGDELVLLHVIEYSAFPAAETGAEAGGRPRSAYHSVSELPLRFAASSFRSFSVAFASISSVRSSAKTTP